MGKNNHVVCSHKLCFQGHVGGHVVMMKEPVVVVPKLQSFSLQIFSQASQNITVKVTVDRSVRRNKFMVNNPLHIKKTMRMLSVELWTHRTFFALGDYGLFHCNDRCFVLVNPTFVSHYDPGDKSWVLISLFMMVFMDEFLNFFNILCCFAGAWSP
jgi:hypothetical protein